ncbi:MAG: beta-ketoacyl-ACP synthase II [Candidatus Omnitrophica bacterium]|nr:beta-ketoacyl-ACP synthase II [Candidatus Omnitrophota bacterium]
MERRRVVITGLGIVSSIGLGADEFWSSSLKGKSGVDLIKDFDASLFDSRIFGAVKGFNPGEYMPGDVAKSVDRVVQLALASARMALDNSKLDLENEDRNRIGVIFGSGLGGIIFQEQQIMRAFDKGAHRINPASVPRITPNAVSSQVAINFKLCGPNMVISNACASGANAVGEAYRKIQNGGADMAFTGGAEASLSEFSFGAYDALKVLSKRNAEPQAASRPFDKDRDGFVLAEGAATLVLEELNHALDRGARIYAEISGYVSNSGAYHMVIPDPSARDISYTMSAVLKDAGMKTEDIDYINAHGTSTLQNDKVETKGIKEVFGENAYKIPVSSTKSMIGHTIGASGAIEALVCALVIDNQIIPPTINYKNPDPDCDLDYVPGEPRRAEINAVLSNSFGFGSNNVCLIFRRYNG